MPRLVKQFFNQSTLQGENENKDAAYRRAAQLRNERYKVKAEQYHNGDTSIPLNSRIKNYLVHKYPDQYPQFARTDRVPDYLERYVHTEGTHARQRSVTTYIPSI